METEDRTPSSETQQGNERSPIGRPSVADYALLEELRYARREAQAEANLAYEDWVARPGSEGYLVYRAAQDRADAAQDQLARWASEIGRELRNGHLALEMSV
jgi:hypothetical protein